jgi:hypothetical protein
MARVCYLGYKSREKKFSVIFSNNLLNITDEWHTKFYPTTATVANKYNCNSTVSYSYNSHVSYDTRDLWATLLV